MNNFSERINKLQESVGLEKTNFSAWKVIDSEGKEYTYENSKSADEVKTQFQSDYPGVEIKEITEVKNFAKKTSDEKKWKTYFKGSDRSLGPAYKSKEEAQKSIPEKESYYGCKGKLEVREVKNFSEGQGEDTEVTDEASARALGESLAKKMWGDKFDQKIFDGVFATALEECGENWNNVAAYLRKVYKGASEMNNFSERLNKLQESVGLEKTNFTDTQTPPVSTTPETPPNGEVASTQEGNPTGTPDKNAEMPKSEKVITLDFSDLTDEEFNEIRNEAKEMTKYPEQFTTDAERIVAFCSWLANSRFQDFCNEALYKGFCGK